MINMFYKAIIITGLSIAFVFVSVSFGVSAQKDFTKPFNQLTAEEKADLLKLSTQKLNEIKEARQTEVPTKQTDRPKTQFDSTGVEIETEEFLITDETSDTDRLKIKINRYVYLIRLTKAKLEEQAARNERDAMERAEKLKANIERVNTKINEVQFKLDSLPASKEELTQQRLDARIENTIVAITKVKQSLARLRQLDIGLALSEEEIRANFLDLTK